MPVQSPITGSSNVSLEREILSSRIVDDYKKELDIDVSRFFRGIEKVGIYVCGDTGYRFYCPLNIAGDDEFYQQLEKFPWYYMDEKWEHSIANKLIKKSDSVLEIGCARGGFLKALKQRGVRSEGLEMNTSALQTCVHAGLTVFPDSIDQFANKRKDSFDVVCSFQVLEHVPHVREFLSASLSTLRPGGILIVSVPNNDGLVLHSGSVILDMPPHHMGLWNINSLIQLQNHFNMRVSLLYLEPLQSYHLGFANNIATGAIQKRIREKFGTSIPFTKKIAQLFNCVGIDSISRYILGHSILAAFKKNE